MAEIKYVDITQKKLNGGLSDTGSPQDIADDETPCANNIRLGEYGGISNRPWVLEKVGDNTGWGATLAITQIEIHDRCGHRNDGVGVCENGDVIDISGTCSDGSQPLSQPPCPFDGCREVVVPNPKGTNIMVLIRAVAESDYTSLQYFVPATKDMKEGSWHDFARLNGVHYFKMQTDGPILWFSNEETNLHWACFTKGDSECEPNITVGEPTCASEYRTNGQPLAVISSGQTNITDTVNSIGNLTVSNSLVGCETDWQDLVKYVQTHPRFLGIEYKYQACPRNGNSERYCYVITKDKMMTQEEISQWEQDHKKDDGGQIIPGQDNDDEWDYNKVLEELKAPQDVIDSESEYQKESWIYSHGWTLKEPWTLRYTEKYRKPNPNKAKIFLWLCYQEGHNECTNYEEDGSTHEYVEKSNWYRLNDVEIPECLSKTVFWYGADDYSEDHDDPVNVPAGEYRKYAISWNEVNPERGWDIHDSNTRTWCPRYCCDDNKKLAGEGDSGIKTNFLTKYAHRLFAIQGHDLIYSTKAISNTAEYLLPSGMGDFLDRGAYRRIGDSGTTYFEDRSGWVTNFTIFDGKPKVHYYSPAGPKIYGVQYSASSDAHKGDEFIMQEVSSSNASSSIYGATVNSSIDYYISSFYGVNEMNAIGIFQGFASESSKIVSGKIRNTLNNLDVDHAALTNFNGLLLMAARRKPYNTFGCDDDDFAIGCLDKSVDANAPNNMLLTYNIGLDAWMPWGPLYVSCWHEFREKGKNGTIKKRLLAGDPRFHQVYQFVEGIRDYTTRSPNEEATYVAPEVYWESKQLNLDVPQKGKQIKGIIVNGYMGPGTEATIGFRLDCQDSARLSKKITYDSIKSCTSTTTTEIAKELNCRTCSSGTNTKDFHMIIDLHDPQKFLTIGLYVHRQGGEFGITNYALLLNRITDSEAWDIARSKSNVSYVGESEDTDYYVNGYPDF